MTGNTAFQEGMAAAAAGQLQEAAAAFQRVRADDAGFLAAQINLAALLSEAGELNGALAAADRAIELDAASPAAHLNRGLILLALKNLPEAELALRQAVRLDPNNPAGLISLGQLALEQGQWSAALALAERGRILAPDDPDGLNLAGQALSALDQPIQAEECYRQALNIAPDFAEAWANLGILLQETGRPADAVIAHDQAIARAGAKPALLINRAVAKLAAGDLDGGFADYEGRWPLIGCNGQGSRFGRRRWQGEPLAADETLLIWGEQGVGDELRFASLVPALLAEMPDAQIIIACDKRIVGLLARSFAPARVIALTGIAGLAPAGVEIPSGSLAAIRHRLGRNFAAPKPAWLAPDPSRSADFATRLKALPALLKVGFAWRGLAATGERGKFYPGLEAMLPLLNHEGLQPVLLQYGVTAAELALVPQRLAQWPDLDLKDDFEGVAALISGLDLVITADTAIKDLAAAAGVPVWCLTHAHDWTSFGTGSDPLQPTRQTFRKEPGRPWADVIGKIEAALRQGELRPRQAD